MQVIRFALVAPKSGISFVARLAMFQFATTTVRFLCMLFVVRVAASENAGRIASSFGNHRRLRIGIVIPRPGRVKVWQARGLQ
jgi:hypothetical protein